MFRHILHFCFGIVILYAVPGNVFAGEYTAMSGPLPPYTINKGLHLNGIAVDTLVLIMTMNGYPLEAENIKLMLWDHALKRTQTGDKLITLNVPQTPSNKKMFKWVGPFYVSKYILIGRKGAKHPNPFPAAYATMKIATIRNSPMEKALISDGISKTALIPSSTHITSLKQLANKQVDFFASEELSAPYLMKAMNMALEDYQVVQVFKEEPLFFAFSPNTDTTLITKLNDTLKKIKKPGTDGRSRFDKIVAKYLPDGRLQ